MRSCGGRVAGSRRGTPRVWIPAGLYLLATDHVAAAVFELVFGALIVVGFTDYIVRPRLVGGEGELPVLLTFVALFGGVEVFGLVGLMLGPLLISMAVALLRMTRPRARSVRAPSRAYRSHGRPRFVLKAERGIEPFRQDGTVHAR